MYGKMYVIILRIEHMGNACSELPARCFHSPKRNVVCPVRIQSYKVDPLQLQVIGQEQQKSYKISAFPGRFLKGVPNFSAFPKVTTN